MFYVEIQANLPCKGEISLHMTWHDMVPHLHNIYNKNTLAIINCVDISMITWWSMMGWAHRTDPPALAWEALADTEGMCMDHRSGPSVQSSSLEAFSLLPSFAHPVSVAPEVAQCSLPLHASLFFLYAVLSHTGLHFLLLLMFPFLGQPRSYLHLHITSNLKTINRMSEEEETLVLSWPSWSKASVIK